MKKLFAFAFIMVAAVMYFYPFEPDSSLYRLQSSIKTIGKSEEDYRQELMQKENELESYEEIIERITADFERAAANTPICPKTGKKIEIKMTDDPRPGLREKCDALLAEIEALEEKLGEY